MVLAFILGAYVRQPFALRNKIEVIQEKEEKLDAELQKLLEDGAKLDKKRQLQFMNAMEWNGKKGIVNDED